LVDVRDQQTYANGHVRGAVNVALRGRLDTWTGIVVPFSATLLLIGSDDEVREATFRLRRIGYDQISGYLQGGMAAWRAAGLEVLTSKLVAPRALHARMQRGEEPMVVDVRTEDEHAELRLGDYANIPVTEFERFGTLLDKQQSIVMVCNSAYRSSLAVGLAERQGFTDIASLDGGLDAWLTEGLPVLGTAKPSPASSGTSAALPLPEPIEPQTLARALADQPQSYLVLDVRPASAFAEFHLPGAQAVTPEQALEQARAADARTRIIVVDRDGTIAWAAAGVIAHLQKDRVVRVLDGGLARWWREVELRLPSASVALPQAQPASSTAPPAPAAAVAKKRSAGC
jgi:rhodanese-related sulfurtransferase